MNDEWRTTQPFGKPLDRVEVGRRRVEGVDTRLPPHHPRGRDLFGIADLGDRPGHLVLIAPRIQFDGVNGHAIHPQPVHRLGNTGPDRAAGLGAIPVRGTVVGPVREVRGDGVGVTRDTRTSRSHLATPSVEQLRRRRPGVDAERRAEAGRHLVEVTVPTPLQPAISNADDLLVRMVQRSQQHVLVEHARQQDAEHRR